MPRIMTDFLDDAVKTHPNKAAFTEEARSLTYKELQEEAYRIAMPIIKSGFRKKPVALYFDKSIYCISSMMAVAYSGNFYSVIDTEMPVERINKIFVVLEPELVLTDRKHFENAKEFFCEDRIIVTEELNDSEIFEETIEESKAKILETDVLYVLFTSGSTGVPKGVVTPHKAITSYIVALVSDYKMDDTYVLGVQVPFYYVMTALDIYGTIAAKAHAYLIPKSKFLFPAYLVQYLYENKINLLSWVPSALCMIANTNAFSVADLSAIRLIVFGGEVMPIKQLKAWQQAVPDAVYINAYGSTEITDGCTYYIVDREFKDEDILPIGIPYSNCDVLVIDEHGNPITEGVGELVVRGNSVGYGYYKDPEKTAEVFIQNPLNSCYPETVYKMGDLVRFNEYGELEYYGRKDFQIKYMGRRIELGEIEANVSSIDGVDENCCVFDSAKKRIVLFYSGAIDDKTLLKTLRSKLPDYMQPRKINHLVEMPHNQNGKINRKLLATQIS